MRGGGGKSKGSGPDQIMTAFARFQTIFVLRFSCLFDIVVLFKDGNTSPERYSIERKLRD